MSRYAIKSSNANIKIQKWIKKILLCHTNKFFIINKNI